MFPTLALKHGSIHTYHEIPRGWLPGRADTHLSRIPMLANRKATRIQLVHDLGLGLMLLLPRVLLLLTILVLLYHMLGRCMTLWRRRRVQLLL